MAAEEVTPFFFPFFFYVPRKVAGSSFIIQRFPKTSVKKKERGGFIIQERIITGDSWGRVARKLLIGLIVRVRC